MKKTTLWLAAAAAALSPTTVTAQDNARVFQPSGPWTADFGDDYCRLIRTFSDGRDTVSISFEKIDTRPSMRLLVLGNAVSVFRRADEIGLDFLPSDTPQRHRYARSVSTDGQQLLIFSWISLTGEQLAPTDRATVAANQAPAPAPSIAELNARDLARGAEITGLSLSSGLTTPIRIETGALRNAVGVLQDCGYDLLSSWNLDGEKHRTLSRAAVPAQPIQLPANTIPVRELARLVGTSNTVRVMVDAQGKATACHVHFATLSEDVNDRVCSHLMGIGYLPALDEEGQALASYWTAPFHVVAFPNPRGL